jgi:hypothetical protein
VPVCQYFALIYIVYTCKPKRKARNIDKPVQITPKVVQICTALFFLVYFEQGEHCAGLPCWPSSVHISHFLDPSRLHNSVTMGNVSSLPEREPWNGKDPVDMCVEGMEYCNLDEKSYLYLYTSDAADLYSVLQCIEKDPTAIARVDECVRLYQSKIAPDKRTRQSHFRSKVYLPRTFSSHPCLTLSYFHTSYYRTCGRRAGAKCCWTPSS